jgi:hypothetical protein
MHQSVHHKVTEKKQQQQETMTFELRSEQSDPAR